jgi:hypothetical protein
VREPGNAGHPRKEPGAITALDEPFRLIGKSAQDSLLAQFCGKYGNPSLTVLEQTAHAGEKRADFRRRWLLEWPIVQFDYSIRCIAPAYKRPDRRRRAWDSNPQPLAGHLISSQAASQFAYPPEIQPYGWSLGHADPYNRSIEYNQKFTLQRFE